MNPDFRVLTNVPLPQPLLWLDWKQERERAEWALASLGNQLSEIVNVFFPGARFHVTLRGPWHTVSDMRVRDWHHEGETFSHAIFWSNIPTEFRNGEHELRAAPCDLVFINNQTVEHRQPALVGGDRWFYRALSLSH